MTESAKLGLKSAGLSSPAFESFPPMTLGFTDWVPKTLMSNLKWKMYSPKSFELPSYDDLRLAKYTWRVVYMYNLFFASKKEVSPSALLDTTAASTPLMRNYLITTIGKRPFWDLDARRKIIARSYKTLGPCETTP